MMLIDATVIVRGGGDVASGTIQRLHRSGFRVLVLELPRPLVVRRTVAFAQAVVDGSATVEDTTAVRIQKPQDAAAAWEQGHVPVLVDPGGRCITTVGPDIVVDATMAKKNTGTHRGMAPVTIALGPGFTAGVDVDAVIETLEGHDLGRVIFSGSASPDTGLSVPLLGYAAERVLRAPCDGTVKNRLAIGDTVVRGDVIAHVGDMAVTASIGGLIHGLIQNGMHVQTGLKIGDVDPRGIQSYCYTIFDKARAIGGGVLEAILYCARTNHAADRKSA